LIAESTETVNAEYVKEHGELKEGNSANTWENLLPSTNYTIYALPIDIEGKEGDLNTLVVKTRAEAGVSEIDIEIEKLSYTSVTITATPNENTILYHYIVIEKDEADAMGEDALMQRLNENENYIDSIVDTYSMTVESNVAYYVVAQGKNRDDKWGVVTKEEFTVAGPAAVETAVEKVTETTVTVTATPNENAVSYEYIVIEKEETDAMDEAALMQKLAEANDLNGIDVWTYTVKSNVEYYVIAQAKNADGRTGEMTKVEFIVAGPATVAVAVEKLNETTVSVAATPNENAVSYSYIIIAKEEADAMTESELKQMISESENKFETANTTEYTVVSNVVYYVIAQAVNADDMSGVMTKVEFTVAGPAAVEIAVEKVTETTVTVTATPNANAVSYHYIVIEKAEADAMDADALVQKLEEANEFTGVDVYTYTVKSNVEYYVVAQAKNADGRTGEMTKVEFIVAGPATVEIAVEETSETSVAITATPNENAVAYHYIVITKAEADAMDADALMQKLNENEDYLEGVNTTEVTVESNVEYYVVAQAKNEDGVWGEVTKVEFVVINTESVTELGEVMFEIYPNPAVEYVRITSNAEIENLVIFSIDGKVVYTETVNQEETMIDVASFAKGSYIVRMLSNDKIFVRRIVVE
jgi:RNase P protein component